jgi:branched-chain amino acid transport system substrate-binding protein
MKTWTGAAALLLAGTLGTACTAEQGADDEGGEISSSEPIMIGSMQDLSGPIGTYGTAINNGAKLAVQQFNDEGGFDGAEVELKEFDTASDKANAASGVRSLTSDGAAAILGPTGSSALVVAAPVAEQLGIVLLAPTSTENFADGVLNDWTYRVGPIEALSFTEVMQQVLPQAGDPKRIALFFDAANNSSIEERKLLEENADELGYEFVGAEAVPAGQTDVTGAVSKILALNPEAIFVSHLAAESAAFMKEVRARGSEVPFMGGPAFASLEIFDLAGEAGDGALTFVQYLASSTEPASQEFRDAYEEEYGDTPDQFAAGGYDGTLALLEAIEQAGSTNREKVKDALTEIRDLQGATGPISYGEGPENSDAGYVVVRVESGSFAEIE